MKMTEVNPELVTQAYRGIQPHDDDQLRREGLLSWLRLHLPKTYRYEKPLHGPDIIIRYRDRITGLIILGTRGTLQQAKREGLWVSKNTLSQGLKCEVPLVYVYILQSQFPEGRWIYWLPAVTLHESLDPSLRLFLRLENRNRIGHQPIHFLTWRNRWRSLIKHVRSQLGDM